ncbi:MAG: rhomboid family intramembrane serine protease [Flavobacteriaceae bacterium]|jgi:membrane associated rhomboid family serine protease|nr:rhomboid family intramembrane serine protease [Flavobacteriaceae bacterium]
MDNFIDKLIDYYKRGTEGIKIIYICIISSVIFWIINFITIKLLDFPLDSFVLLSARYFIPFVWTILTFPLIQSNFLELLFTMIMLYFTEKIFRIYFNGKSLVKFFFLGNIAGGVLFLLFSFLTGQTWVFLNGAALGVYSSIFAVISYNPKMRITLFPLPIQFPIYVLGLILIGLDFFSIINRNQVVGLFVARLGAAAFGYFYMKSFQRGNDFLGKLVPDFDVIHKIVSIFTSRPKPRLRVKKGTSQQKEHPTRNQTDSGFNTNDVKRQEQINKILDKISKSGYDSLTKEEKDFLFNSSK